MIIDIPRLQPDENRFKGSEPAEILDINDDDVRVTSPVDYDLSVSLITGILLVRGRIETRMELRCVRCAEFYSASLVAADFCRDVQVDDTTESVDLTGDIRESIILAFPVRPVCGPDCRGLCSQCGTNLNQKQCECRPPDESTAWGVLDNLKLE